MESYISQLKQLLEDYKICSSHGIEHALKVMNNAKLALKEYSEYPKEANDNQLILLASLLHDADDPKFFSNKNNENARKILSNLPKDDVEKIVKMINYVSSSKNGDTIPEEYKENHKYLIPR